MHSSVINDFGELIREIDTLECMYTKTSNCMKYGDTKTALNQLFLPIVLVSFGAVASSEQAPS